MGRELAVADKEGLLDVDTRSLSSDPATTRNLRFPFNPWHIAAQRADLTRASRGAGRIVGIDPNRERGSRYDEFPHPLQARDAATDGKVKKRKKGPPPPR